MHQKSMHRCNEPSQHTNKIIKNTTKAENERLDLYNVNIWTCRTYLVIWSRQVFVSTAGQDTETRLSTRDTLSKVACRHTSPSGKMNERNEVEAREVEATFRRIWCRNTCAMMWLLHLATPATLPNRPDCQSGAYYSLMEAAIGTNFFIRHC